MPPPIVSVATFTTQSKRSPICLAWEHRRDDLADETLRVWPVHPYLIVDRSGGRSIEILRVASGFRDIFPLFAAG